jgi:hypothetical protein
MGNGKVVLCRPLSCVEEGMYGYFGLRLYGEWSAFRTDRFIPEETAPVTHEICFMGPCAGMHALE